jgi:SAM-dependent methyltransferase
MTDSVSNPPELPRLYRDLAEWWPLLDSPEEYAEEAEFYRQTILSSCELAPQTLLELGSGGGNNASHLKQHFQMTLVDLSPGMLEVSRRLNPECEHVQGDMRGIRLGRSFDAVFIHDAIEYMTSESDLRSAIRTAYDHCRPGGAALFAPDHSRETYQPSTDHGGHDRGHRGLRYLEWSWDPDPEDTTYLTAMVYMMREGNDQVQVVQDLHVCGLFAHDRWIRAIQDAGFLANSVPLVHSEIEAGTMQIYVGLKRLGLSP